MNYGGITAQFGDNYFSDHSPIQIEIAAGGAYNRKLFYFINILVDDDIFISIVSQVWSTSVEGTNMYRLWKKLHLCKEPLKNLKLILWEV